MNKKQLLAYGLSVFSFDQERFNSWLNSKNKYLEGKKPKELTKTKEGLYLLRILLDRIEYGNFAQIMIKTFYETEIDSEFFKELAELLSIKDENHTIYFSSNGGDLWLVEPIIKMINDNKERLEIIGVREISSSALSIFLGVKCKKSITKNTFAIWHKPSFSFNLDDKNKPRNDFYKFKNKYIVEGFSKDFELEYKDWGLKKSEIKKYKKGEDVYFSYERFQEIINHTSQR